MKTRNYLFLLRANHRCHACHREQPVVALGTPDLYDVEYDQLPTSKATSLFILSEVYSMPPELLEIIRVTGALYEQRKSAAGDDTYFANWCINCGVGFGDFYLAGQPGGAFFPKTIKAASAIELVEIPLVSELEFYCVYPYGGRELSRTHARGSRSSPRSRVSHIDSSQW